MYALILLDVFLDVLSESMLFRVLSEIIVCVAASFEKSENWLQNHSFNHLLYHTTDITLLKQKAVDREAGDFKSQRSGTIESYFSQQQEKQSVILHIYGDLHPTADPIVHPPLGFCCSKPLQEVLGKDPLYSFDSNEQSVENVDTKSYLVNTTGYFAEMLHRIHHLYPQSMETLLTSHPYLYHLAFGDLSLVSILQLTPPPSTFSFSKSASELEAIMLTLVATPELSLEVIPAVGYLSLILRASQKTYQQWIADQPFLPDSVQRCYFHCVKLASFFVTSGNSYAQLLLSELLGLLGAVASERFRSVSREDSVQPHLTEFDLARIMVKRFFVKDLMGLPRSEIQNRIAFTVQSLLHFLKIQMDLKPLEALTADRSLLREVRAKEQVSGESMTNDELNEDSFPRSLQPLFTQEELSVISQYWSTEYTLRGDKQRIERIKCFDGINCTNYAKWVTKLAMRLLILCPTDSQFDSTDCSSRHNSSTPQLTPSSSSILSQSDYQIYYIFKSLFYPSCADKASYLLPYLILFSLRYHYQKQQSIDNNQDSSTPRLFVRFSDIPFFLTLSKYLNNVLTQCDIQSDSEYKHCCTEILTLINTLRAWSIQYQTMSGRMKDKAWLRDLLNGFLSLLDRTQIIRVAKTLGQYEYALRYETVIEV